jgi:hypothetical protein
MPGKLQQAAWGLKLPEIRAVVREGVGFKSLAQRTKWKACTPGLNVVVGGALKRDFH